MKVNKALAIGLVCMSVGAILVVVGLLKVPAVAAVLVILGVLLGFTGYKIYEKRKDYQKPGDLFYG